MEDLDSCNADSTFLKKANTENNRLRKSSSREKAHKKIMGIGLWRALFRAKPGKSSLVDDASVTATAAVVGEAEEETPATSPVADVVVTSEMPAAPASIATTNKEPTEQQRPTYINTSNTTTDGSEKGEGGGSHSSAGSQASSKQKQIRSSNWDKVPHQKKRRKPSPNTIDRRLTRKYKSQPSSTEWYHKVATKNKLGSINENVFCTSDSEEDQEECECDEGGGSFDEKDGTRPNNSMIFEEQQQHDHPKHPVLGNNGPVLTPIQNAKRNLLNALNRTKGDSSTPAFQKALQELLQHYDPTTFNTRQKPKPGQRTWKSRSQRLREQSFEGIGISAGKPSFPGCIGRNDDGDPLYKLGTMSFDMFTPTQLVVSIQGTFCLIDVVDGKDPDLVEHIPNNLVADVRYGSSPVRTYNVVTPFTIEPWKPEFGVNSPNKGITEDQARIRGIMTTYGFILPYPTQNHRFSVWFTGGSIEMVGEKDDDAGNDKNEKWFQIFDHHQTTTSSSGTSTYQKTSSRPKRTMAESGKLLAAKVLMGACSNDKLDDEGRLSYTLTRPMSSHIDLIYLDKTLQVLRGSSGTVYVHVRIPGRKAVEPSSLQSNEMLPQDILDQDSYLLSSEVVHAGRGRGDDKECKIENTNAGIFL